jgi:hypothetical protein
VDELLREVRKVREAYAASHGFDIRRMVAALRELGIASGRELVSFPPRPAIAVQPPQADTDGSKPPEAITRG